MKGLLNSIVTAAISMMLARRPIRWLVASCLGLLLVIVGSVFQAKASPLDQNTVVQPAQTSAAARSLGQVPVEVNLELASIYNISIKDNSFMADGFLLIRFPPQMSPVTGIGPENPCFTFENDIEASQYTRLQPRDSVLIDKTDPAQRHHYAYDFSGKFAMGDKHQHRLNPFGTLQLQVMLSPTCRLDYGKQKIALVVESFGQGIDAGDVMTSNLELPVGYAMIGSNLQAQIRKWPRSSYSWMVADITIAASTKAAFYRWIVPLMVVLAIVIAAPSLNSNYFEARISIPSASLLTLVFMHQAYRSDLPGFPYLTYMDKLFVYSYVMCLLMFLLLAVDSKTSWTNRHILAVNLKTGRQLVLSGEQLIQLCCVIGLILAATIGWHL